MCIATLREPLLMSLVEPQRGARLCVRKKDGSFVAFFRSLLS